MKHVFHGTSSTYIDAIMKLGLVPGAAKGGDYWAEHHELPMHGIVADKKKPATYFATKSDVAVSFAKIAAHMTGGKALLLSISLPDDAFAKAKVDDDFSEDEGGVAYKTHEIIKPEWIVTHVDASHLPGDPEMQGVVANLDKLDKMSKTQLRVSRDFGVDMADFFA